MMTEAESIGFLLFHDYGMEQHRAIQAGESILHMLQQSDTSICLGCDRHEDDDDYGRDSDCAECFRDPTPLTQEAVTAGWSPATDTRNKHDRSL